MNLSVCNMMRHSFLFSLYFFSLALFSPSSFAETASGTGFFITSTGYIATNYHVIEGASSIRVQDYRGNTFPATIIRSDSANDLAILKVDGKFVGLPLSRSSSVRKGDSVFTLGFPNTQLQGVATKLTEGTISSLSGVKDEPNNFQISVPIQPGNSGGALFNRDGSVIGIVVAKLRATAAMKTASQLPEAVNYAVKSNYLLELIDTDPNVSEQIQMSVKKGKERTLSDVVSKVEPSVVLIHVSLRSQAQPVIAQNSNPPSVTTPITPISAERALSPLEKNNLGVKAEIDSRFEDAVRLYRESANGGNAYAQHNLGVMYFNGKGSLPKDEAEAVHLFRLAAAQGNAGAQHSLGFMYLNGRGGLSKDEVEAVRLYRLSAAQGNASAQYNLGVMSANGQGGLSKDEVEAVRLYRLSAAQGNASAQFNLGYRYLNGRGGLSKDEVEAVRLYRLSAAQGNADAQYNLGVMSANGQGGLPKDEVEAARLFRLAAAQGNANAKNALLPLVK